MTNLRFLITSFILLVTAFMTVACSAAPSQMPDIRAEYEFDELGKIIDTWTSSTDARVEKMARVYHLLDGKEVEIIPPFQPYPNDQVEEPVELKIVGNMVSIDRGFADACLVSYSNIRYNVASQELKQHDYYNNESILYLSSEYSFTAVKSEDGLLLNNIALNGIPMELIKEPISVSDILDGVECEILFVSEVDESFETLTLKIGDIDEFKLDISALPEIELLD